MFTPGTDFQQLVWQALQTIKYGATASYKEQSLKMNIPGAIRAVANADGMNRISILIPCHRVIGSDGNLTGYGGGIHRKNGCSTLKHQIFNCHHSYSQGFSVIYPYIFL